jgi:hypothetical protein
MALARLGEGAGVHGHSQGLARDLIGDLTREILGIIGEKRKDSGGIFWVSRTDATSSNSRVGGDCEAGEFRALAGMWAGEIPGVEQLPRWLGLKRENGNDDRCLGIDRAQRKRF